MGSKQLYLHKQFIVEALSPNVILAHFVWQTLHFVTDFTLQDQKSVIACIFPWGPQFILQLAEYAPGTVPSFYYESVFDG